MKKHLHTFEEFIGDEETDNLKKKAIDQEEKDGDQISVDPDQNSPEFTNGDFQDDEEGND
jgi:hypothetical protein